MIYGLCFTDDELDVIRLSLEVALIAYKKFNIFILNNDEIEIAERLMEEIDTLKE